MVLSYIVWMYNFFTELCFCLQEEVCEVDWAAVFVPHKPYIVVTVELLGSLLCKIVMS